MLLFEELLGIILATGVGVFLIAIPGYKLIRSIVPPKRDPLKEAQQRLEQARLEAEAARLNKETESLYNKMYHEALEDEEAASDEEEHKFNRRL